MARASSVAANHRQSEDHLAEYASQQHGPERLPLQPMDLQRLHALREQLRLAGLCLQSALHRPDEVQLAMAADGPSADNLVVTLAISPRTASGPALLRTQWFDFGYLSAGNLDPAPMRQILSVAKQFAAVADDAAIARHLMAAMRPAEHSTSHRLDPGSQLARDGVATSSGKTVEFSPALCSRRPELPPRAAGPRALLIGVADKSAKHSLSSWTVFDGAQQPGSAEMSARAMAGRCWVRTAEGLRRLTMHPTCAACAVRGECAGCWHPTESEPDARQFLELALADAALHGPVEAIGSELTALVGHETAHTTAQILAISGADLSRRDGRLALAKRLRRVPQPTAVLVLGRQPAVIAQSNGTEIRPDLLAQLQPADAPLVARSLLGGALQLSQARWPGRDRADPWWLKLEVRKANQPDRQPVEHVTLLLNRRCVTVCRYCDLPLRLRDDMPLSQVWAVLEEVAAQGAKSLEFFGGEVTLRPDLLTILARARELGLQTFVTTTGVGIDDNKLRLLARAEIHDLSISCDAADPAIHDDLKSRQGMHAAALHAARGLRRHLAPQVGWNSVITPFNLDELPKVVALAGDLGLDGATFFLCQPVAELGNATPLLSRDQYRHLLNDVLPRCQEIGRERGVHVGIRPAIDREPTAPAKLLDRLAEGTYNRIHATQIPCRVVDHMVSIHAGGDVRLCNQPLMQFETSAVVGNLNAQGLQEVFVSPAAQRFRAKAGHLEVCRFCTFDHATDGADHGLSAQVAGECAVDRAESSRGPR